jgi:anti-sigma B factor antagonist
MEMTQETLDNGITRIALAGRLDVDGAQAIDLPFSLATTSKVGKFVVDLTAVPFIASIGLRLLLTAGRAQARRGGRMVLIPPAGMGEDILRTAGVDLVMTVAKDLPAALAALETAPA